MAAKWPISGLETSRACSGRSAVRNPDTTGPASVCSCGLYHQVGGQGSNLRAHGSPGGLLQLQRKYGNHYVQRLVALARRAEGEAEVDPALESAIARARGGGQALNGLARLQMERAFGAPFGGVRVHKGTKAHLLNQALNAVAFTAGRDIFFRESAYNPGTSAGKELLAQELTHVVQRAGGTVQGKLILGPAGDNYEQEADSVAREVVAGLDRGAASPVQRRCGCGGYEGHGEATGTSSLERMTRLQISAQFLQRQEDDDDPDSPNYPPDWQHGAPTKPVAPDPHVVDIPGPGPQPSGGPYREPGKPSDEAVPDPVKQHLPSWLLVLLSAGAIALIIACFATGICEAGALIAAAGAATAAIVIGILRGAGVDVRGEGA